MLRTAGFTLVELLIVIAIIGIIASVVLTSLNDARIDGVDAKVIAEMDAISKRANVELVQQGTFDVVCGTGTFTQSQTIAGLVTSINGMASTSVICNSTGDAYAVSVGLSDTYWCIDSSGASGEVATPLITAPPQLACP